MKRAISQLDARGSTDLSAGYLRGLQEAGRVAGAAGATVLLISDGHANAGVTDPDTLGGIAGQGPRRQRHHVDAGLRARLRRAAHVGDRPRRRRQRALRRGSRHGRRADRRRGRRPALADRPGRVAADAALAAGKGGPGDQRPAGDHDTGDGDLVELGSFYADETRKLLLTFDIPAIAALGLAEVATCEFTWVELPTLEQHTVTVPLHVNVVPGDQAAGRIPDPTVRTELVYLQVQQAKRRASGHLSAGDTDAALAEIRQAQGTLSRRPASRPGSPARRADRGGHRAGLPRRPDRAGHDLPGGQVLLDGRLVQVDTSAAGPAHRQASRADRRPPVRVGVVLTDRRAAPS